MSQSGGSTAHGRNFARSEMLVKMRQVRSRLDSVAASSRIVTYRLIFVVTVFAVIAGCASTTLRWRRAPVAAPSITGPIFVVILAGPALPPDRAKFPAQLVAVVREHDPKAELIYGNEVSASRLALQRGARFLLVATVLLWRDAETQYSGEPDSIGVAVRLMQLQPRAVVGEFQFTSRGGKLAVRDAPADHLLNERFRNAIRQLLAPAHP
jgi:hypothetical protein